LDEVAELPLRPGDVLTSMQQCREFGPVGLVGDERVDAEHGFYGVDRLGGLIHEYAQVA